MIIDHSDSAEPSSPEWLMQEVHGELLREAADEINEIVRKSPEGFTPAFMIVDGGEEALALWTKGGPPGVSLCAWTREELLEAMRPPEIPAGDGVLVAVVDGTGTSWHCLPDPRGATPDPT